MTAPGRAFTAGQVLTVAAADAQAQQCFCGYGELLDILGYLLDDVPIADAIPTAILACRPHVHAAYPALARVAPPAVDASDTAVLSWLATQEAARGTEFLLTPLDEKE